MNMRQELLEMYPSLDISELDRIVSITATDTGYSEDKLLRLCILGISTNGGDAVEFMRSMYRQLKNKKIINQQK